MSDERRERIDADQEELYGYPGEPSLSPAPKGDTGRDDLSRKYWLTRIKQMRDGLDRAARQSHVTEQDRAMYSRVAWLEKLLRAAPPGGERDATQQLNRTIRAALSEIPGFTASLVIRKPREDPKLSADAMLGMQDAFLEYVTVIGAEMIDERATRADTREK